MGISLNQYTYEIGNPILVPFRYKHLICHVTDKKFAMNVVDNEFIVLKDGKLKQSHELPYILPYTEHRAHLVNQLFKCHHFDFKPNDRVIIPLYFGLESIKLPKVVSARSYIIYGLKVDYKGLNQEHNVSVVFHDTPEIRELIHEIYFQ